MQRANLSRASVGNRYHFNELRRVEGSGLGRGEQGLDVDVPFCHQPKEGLRRDDRSRPDECPFLPLNVCIVALRGEVDGEEGRPDDQERPHIGMKLSRERVMQ